MNLLFFFFFKQKTAYEIYQCDWSSDVCSSDLAANELIETAQAIVATGKYIGEGFDLPRLDTLFLAMPIAWKGLLTQYAGRIHRESEGKESVTIFDYVDSSIPMLERMFRKREKGYKAMGYQLTFS